MTRRQRRLLLIGSALGVLGLAVALVLTAMRDSIVFFNSPTDVVEKKVSPGARIRIGGLVRKAPSCAANRCRCLRRDRRQPQHSGRLSGLLPDLFREGQGVVAEGALDTGGVFRAETVLAKHD